ncbi:MAG TPA: HDOD domain-containing protein [Bacteroidota bacterium]|nr:HDOD domain-containing protein [Bacteroidota bacterium]
MITPEQIRERVKTIIQLPALPAVAMEVVDLVDNPKTSASKLGRVISSDQALTAKVLKIANSPFYGFPKKISTIDFAIIVLGFDALKEIVISISLVSSLQKKSDMYFNAKTFWDHSISTGVIGRKLAHDLGYRISGEVFVAGLLHDMGLSALHRYFNGEFVRIVDIAHESDLSILEAEESVLGVTHAEVGGWLAERWNLPEQLIEAISLHHAPSKAKVNKELVALVHCADVLAWRLDEKKELFEKGIEFDPAALELLRLNDEYTLSSYIEQYRGTLQNDIEQATSYSKVAGA